MHIRCPHCRNPVEIVDDRTLDDVSCPSCGSSFGIVDPAATATWQPLQEDESPQARSIGHFELNEQLGMGAFGAVWKAWDTELDRTVAVKVPRQGQLTAEEMEKFLREARAAAQLKHPNLVPVHEVGREGSTVYIVSDFIDGSTLTVWLTGHRPSHREAATLWVTIADALHHAHEQGVIHRDLKPGNIMLDQDQQPHIMDFGLAKREAGEITMTMNGQILGTPAYMSPEQARGESRGVDRRADIYSLGVILFELLTGERPFRGNTRMLLHQILSEDPPSPRKLDASIDRDLETICLKCLRREPDRRYATAVEAAADVKRWLNNQPILARPVSRTERAWLWCRRRPVVAGASAIVAATIAISVTLYFVQRATHHREQMRIAFAGLLDQLETCEFQDVPGLVDGIRTHELFTQTVLNQRLSAAEQTADAQSILRWRLALLESDVSQVSNLKDALLAAEVEQVPVLCEYLARHGTGLADELWFAASQSTSDSGQGPRLLRAASVLALVDSENDGDWATVSSAVVDAVLQENPLYVATWRDLLRPVRHRLIDDLVRVFRNEEEQRSEPDVILATSLLREYAADDPELLGELILSANTRQYSILFDVFRKHEKTAVALLHSELDRQLQRSWRDAPLAEHWQAPSAVVVRVIEEASGMLTERFAFCQTLPLSAFSDLAHRLGKCGYRPIRVRPFASDDSVFVAAAWDRDGAEWKLDLDLTEEEVQDRDKTITQNGFVAVDIAGYIGQRDSEPAELYATVWRKKQSAGEESRLYVGISHDEQKTIYDKLESQGFLDQACLGGLRGLDDQPRYCGIKRKRSDNPRYYSSWSWNETGAGVEDKVHLDRVLSDINLTAPHHVPPSWQEMANKIVAEADEALKDNPEDLDALVNRSAALLALAKNQAALNDLDFMLNRNPTSSWAYAYRAIVHARLGQTSKALADLQTASELPVKEGINLPWAEFIVDIHRGAFQEAEDRMDAYLETYPDSGKAAHVAARAYSSGSQILREKDPATAAQYREQAVDLLEQAISRGFEDVRYLQAASMDAVRDHPDFVRLFRELTEEPRYCAVWKTDPENEAIDVHGLSVGEHLTACQTLANEGYRIRSIDGLTVNGNTQAASVWHRPLIPDAEKEVLARRQANAALTLLLLGRGDRVWPLLKDQPDPRLQTWILQRLVESGRLQRSVAEALWSESDLGIQRTLLVALADERMKPLDDRDDLERDLIERYRMVPNSGIHSAIRSLLKRWGRQDAIDEIDTELATGQIEDDRRWYQTRTNAHTMAIINGPVTCLIGSPGSERGRYSNEKLHHRVIPRTFAMGTTEVTVKQYRSFRESLMTRFTYTKKYAPEDDCPQVSVHYYYAAKYCRWLSEQEGIPEDQMCYPPIDEIEEGMRLPDDFLNRTGYRLPTEAEWECACRSGTTTSRYFGESDTLLSEYAWSSGNSAVRVWPVGLKRPNLLGMFDLYGNVFEWCSDEYGVYNVGTRTNLPVDSVLEPLHVDKRQRVLRGGSYSYRESASRSAYRFRNPLIYRTVGFGFRLARTLPDDEPDEN